MTESFCFFTVYHRIFFLGGITLGPQKPVLSQLQDVMDNELPANLSIILHMYYLLFKIKVTC